MQNNPANEDTITAIATPIGQAGIGIVRISGSRANRIAEKIFHPRKPIHRLESHRLYLGYFIDPASGATIDEVLISFMKAPHTYTREDVVEINAHSGYILLSRILEIIIREGARLAKPGEFTFRAFMNGRIDLTQAEATVDLINARSAQGLQLAAQQIKGELKVQVESLKDRGLDILAHLETAIDFPEDEADILTRDALSDRMEKELIEPIQMILQAHARRKIWIEGLRTVIAGRVNAGKSSLLNRLLNEERAIVTPVPGTTRDVIETTIHIEGIPLRLMDTAGFRPVDGTVEKIGIQLTERKLAEADLSLAVIDQSRPLNQDDYRLLSKVQRDRTLLVINKIDLPSKLERDIRTKALADFHVLEISALTGKGIEGLRTAIRDRILQDLTDPGASEVVPNLRHKEALLEASRCFEQAALNTREGAPLEIIAMDLISGLEALSELVGDTSADDVLDKIFSQFCIGK